MSDNDGQFEQGNTAAQTHGMTGAFAKSGDVTVLTEPQRDRWVEIRGQLATDEGALEALRDKAASLALVVEWGQAWLRDKAEQEGAVKAFESPMLSRWFTAFESFRRAVESLHRMHSKGDGGLTSADVLEALLHDKDK